MASQNPNRGIQFLLESLTGLEQSSSLPEPEGRVAEEQQRSQNRQVLKKNVLKRKRSLSPQKDRAIGMPGVRPYDFTLKGTSPWESYWRIFELKFDRFVIIVKTFSEREILARSPIINEALLRRPETQVLEFLIPDWSVRSF